MDRKKKYRLGKGRQWLTLLLALCLIGTMTPVQIKAQENSTQNRKILLLAMDNLYFTNEMDSGMNYQEVMIKNIGTVATGKLSVEIYGENVFTISASEINSISVDGEDIIAVTPKDNVEVGSYEAALVIKNESGDIREFMGMYLEILPEIPEVSMEGSDAVYICGETENVTPLVVKAASLDGGELKYQWYRRGKNGTDMIFGETGSTFTPPTDFVGDTYYFCVVSNEKNGMVSTQESESVLVMVTEGEGGETGVPRPVISLDPQYSLIFSNRRGVRSETLTIKNIGTQPTGELTIEISGNEEIKNAFDLDPSGGKIPSIAPGSMVQFTINVKSDLSLNVGEYNGTVKITNASNTINEQKSLSLNVCPKSPEVAINYKTASYMKGQTAIPLEITANSPDGGSLSYRWFIQAEGEGGHILLSEVTGNTFTPPTDVVGTTTYFCEITNTLLPGSHFGYANAYIENITITVTADNGNGSGENEPSSPGTESGSGENEPSSPGTENGSGENEPNSPGTENGSGENEPNSPGIENGSDSSENTPENSTGLPTDREVIYQIIEGAESSWSAEDNGRQTTQNGETGNNWTVGDGHGCTFRGNGEFSKFNGIKVDGILLDQSYYTVREGSTIVTLLPAYLNTLTAGSHTVEMVWTDGFALTTFTVNTNTAGSMQSGKDEVPKTGETTPVAGLLLLMGVSGTGMILSRKRNDKFKTM